MGVGHTAVSTRASLGSGDPGRQRSCWQVCVILPAAPAGHADYVGVVSKSSTLNGIDASTALNADTKW
jgi:hypothetical protein